MFRQSARSGLRPDQKPPELSPAMGNYSCRQRGSLPVITRNHPIPIVGQVIEVRYLYSLKSSNALYQPIYQGVRTDVDVSECLLTQLKYKPEDAE